MTFGNYLINVLNLEPDEISQNELDELYETYLNSEYYNFEKGL